MNPTANLLVRALERANPGDRAALRRATLHDPPMAFFRLTSHLLDAEGPARIELESKWLIICASLARGLDFVGGQPLGAAMALADVSEMRLTRLLQSHGEVLFDHLREVIHQLASRGQSFGADDLTELVLSDGHQHRDSDGITREERMRRRVARDYYRALRKNEQ